MYSLMLLDDESILLEGLKSTVDWEANGFEVVCTARHGFEGIEQFLDHQPDAIITDIRMRFMDGLKFIRSIRSMDQDVEIAILSAYDVFDHAKQALSLNVTDYLLKPIEPEAMADCLARMKQRLDARRSITRRLLQADRYAGERGEQLTGLARKRLLTGQAQGDELNHLNLGDLSRAGPYRVLIVDSRDAELFSVPVAGMLSEALADNTLFTTTFDDGRVCLALEAHGEPAALNRRIEASLSRIDEALSLRTSAALGDRVETLTALHDSYRSADRQLSLARIAGLFGLVNRSDGLFSKDRFSYPYDLEQSLLQLLPNGTAPQFERWAEGLFRFLRPYPDHTEFLLRSLFQRALLRMIEVDGIALSDDPMYRAQLEAVLSQPADERQAAFAQALAALADSVHPAQSGLLGGYLFSMVEEAKRWVLSNLSDPALNLRTTAAHLHISAPYLGRVFKRAVGKPFSGYVNERRVEMARHLLSLGEARIGDIAERVGFENQPYFQVLFKKQVGVTPGEYRSRRDRSENKP